MPSSNRKADAKPGGWFGVSCEGMFLPALTLSSVLGAGRATGAPFMLLEDQSRGRALLLTQPCRLFMTERIEDVRGMLEEIRTRIAGGATVAGFLSYRAGTCFDTFASGPLHLPPGARRAPLLWFAEFASHLDFRLVEEKEVAGRMATPIVPAIRRGQFEAMVSHALERIRRGDLYQVNLTFPAMAPVSDPARLYGAIRKRARAPFGAYIDMGDRHVLSFSPELFFRTEGQDIETRPMKGTRPRGATMREDGRAVRALLESPKDRAENLMIVDLLRNDLARVCHAGSVKVPHLFTIEAYPTVWQMTSTVIGRLAPDRDALSVLQAIFPCGSVTGAPKIMATHIIGELEQFERGIYTGAIGWMNACGATFSVPIRTIDVNDGNGRLDVGAGIVADSRPRAEWYECLAKGRFLSR